MRESIRRHWEDIKGNAKWDALTALGKLLLSSLPYVGVGALIGGYLAFRAWLDAQPIYFVVSLFLGVLAFIVTIANGIREWRLWTRWKRGQLSLQQEKTSPTLGPHEILHPGTNSMLWRWDVEAGTLGPFCPTHPQEHLFLKGKHGGRKQGDFEKDHLSFNWFVCSIDEEEFKSHEAYANRVYELRAQVTSRFRDRLREQGLVVPNEKHDSTSGVLEIEYLHSEIKWKSNLGGPICPLVSEVPHNATLFLQVTAKITATPPRVLEDIMLDLAGESIEAQDWAPERIDQREICFHFRLPSLVGYGKQPAHLMARAFGPNSGVIEKYSQGFTVVIAHSLSDLQKFSGTSGQKTIDLENNTKDSTNPPPPADLFAIEFIERQLLWRAQNETELHPFVPDHSMLHDVVLVLKVKARITAIPALQVEDIRLEIEGPHDSLYPYDWNPQEVSGNLGYERNFYFEIRPSSPPGPYVMRLYARAWDGTNRLERRSQNFDVYLSRSYSELLK